MNDRACIIGAGASGLFAAKHFMERGVPFDCFEKAASYGGIWNYDGHEESPMYRSCHAVAPMKFMACPDLELPEGHPVYPHYTYVMAYLSRYVEKFGLKDKIIFNTSVEQVSPDENGEWRVTLGTGETKSYHSIVVCNGHFSEPRIPEFPGSFNGRILHVVNYHSAEPFRDKNVLVVGGGHSGADISCELHSVSNRIFLSMRRPLHIFPKFIFGKPFLEYSFPHTSWLPLPVQRLSVNFLMWLGRGSYASYNYPEPDHKILNSSPVVTSRLLESIGDGDITVKPGVKSFEGDEVEFENGSRERVDAIILATGYKVSFPFFAPDVFSFEDHKTTNYLHVVNLHRPNLYFIGLVEPLGAPMPLFEIQARWVAGLHSGRCKLPSMETMKARSRAWDAKNARRFGKIARSVIQTDYFSYVNSLNKEIVRQA